MPLLRKGQKETTYIPQIPFQSRKKREKKEKNSLTQQFEQHSFLKLIHISTLEKRIRAAISRESFNGLSRTKGNSSNYSVPLSTFGIPKFQLAGQFNKLWTENSVGTQLSGAKKSNSGAVWFPNMKLFKRTISILLLYIDEKADHQ